MFNKREPTEMKVGVGCFLLALLVQASLLTLLVYALVHFVIKYW